MQIDRLGKAIVSGLVAILSLPCTTLLAANPDQTPGTTAAPAARSIGRSAGRTVYTPTVRESSRIPTVRTSANSGRPVSMPNPRATGAVAAGPVINGTNVANRVPAASRVGDNAPRMITRTTVPNLASPPPPTLGISPAVTSGWTSSGTGGVTVNPGPGVTVNRGYTYGPVAAPTAPGYEVDTNSAWYRRYQDRTTAYPYESGYLWGPYGYTYDPYRYNGYGYGTYGPVFVNAATNYVFGPQIGQNYGDVGQAPMEAPAAAPREREREVERDDRDDRGVEQGDQGRERGRRPRGTGITPEKLHDLMVEGVRLFKEAKYNEAASTFLRVTLADRQNIDATLAYAVSRFATGDYQIAGLAVRRAVRRMPEVVDSPFDVRSRYTRQEDFALHLARLEQYVVDNPEADDAWMVLGFIRHFSGQQELAVETFRRLQLLPGADVGAVEIFLAAKPAAPAPESQPADVTPVIISDRDRPVPAVDLPDSQTLISMEIVD